MAKSKRDIIIETIEAGEATMESLIAAADCKYESVMSNFSMLRLMGKCPVKDVEIMVDEKPIMTYRLVTSEEWEKIKSEKSANTSTRTATPKCPAERILAAEKRVARCVKTEEAAVKRATDSPDSALFDLRSQKASIERKIADLEMADAQTALDADPDAQVKLEGLRNPVPVEDESDVEVVATEDGDVDFD